MDNKETKPTSFRISANGRKRFREITQSEGWSQDEAMDKLISIYELEQAKVLLGGRRTEIETFETHMQSLSEIYRMSLQLSQDAEARIHAAFANTLDSNQNTIQELQSSVQALKQSLNQSKEQLQTTEQSLEQYLTENAHLQSEIAKTDSLCKEYQEKNESLSSMFVEYKSDREENQTFRLQLDNLQKQLEERNLFIESLESKLALQTDQAQMNINLLKEQAASDLKFSNLEIKEMYMNQLDDLKTKHHEAMEKSNALYKELMDELEQLRRENYQ